jgi:hypothetical protein
MRFIELFGLIFITAILVAIVFPVPCLPPSCGPVDAAPLSVTQLIFAYLYQPLTWIIIVSWLTAITVWIRRSRKK